MDINRSVKGRNGSMTIDLLYFHWQSTAYLMENSASRTADECKSKRNSRENSDEAGTV